MLDFEIIAKIWFRVLDWSWGWKGPKKMLANDPPVSDCRMLCLKERMLENLSLSLILHSFGTLGSLTNDHTHDLYEKCQSILSLQQLQLWFLTQLESLGHVARREGGRNWSILCTSKYKCMVVYLKAQLESLGHDARGGGRSWGSRNSETQCGQL